MAELKTIVMKVGEQDALEADAARFALVDSEGQTRVIAQPEARIGVHPSNDVVLTDPAVSRFHCVIRIEEEGFRLIDEGSLNGTTVDGVRVNDGWLRDGCRLGLGASELLFRVDGGRYAIDLHSDNRWGDLVGSSVAMRRAFAMLARCATSDATVLIEGETGTGKEAAAEGLHRMSARAEGPFVLVDCGSIPANLIESELFGHAVGAFTGATHTHSGAFEEASGGTIFLDEIGELPLDMQPKLLRVLEQKRIRRVGETHYRDVDVRVVAATHRNLRQMVNDGEVRPDLYYRLAVVSVVLPPLRDRREDIPILVTHLLERMGVSASERARFESTGFLDELRRGNWPGNVRELRNHLERALVFADLAPPMTAASPDVQEPFADARARAIETFERDYVAALLEHHDENVSEAARASGLSRPYLHKLLRRHGLR